MKKVILVLCILYGFLFAINSFSATIYVNHSAEGINNGTSWSNAYLLLQSALDAALSGDEIWVVAGTYYPTKQVGGTGERFRTFQMKNGVGIYGGFSGAETERDDRDWNKNLTVLSGDIGVENDITDNCYHIFYHPDGLGLINTAILDGLVLEKGKANGSSVYFRRGAAIYNENNSPGFTNCEISGNTSSREGGGVYNSGGSPSFTNCGISGNTSNYSGGGVYNSGGSPSFTNCGISGNTSNYSGGGVFNSGSSPGFTNCVISGNECFDGGGVYNSGGSPSFTNCEISGNECFDGGGVYNSGGSPSFTNCEISGNTGGPGGGVYNSGNSSPSFTNCEISGNTSGDDGGGVYNSGGSPSFTNCEISGNTNNGSEGGGGVFNESSSPSFTNCEISGNTCYSGGGGGVYNSGNSSPSFTNCEISGNTNNDMGINGFGGGVYNSGGSPSFTNCEISGNTSNDIGGGVCNFYGSLSFTNCTVVMNTSYRGGGIFIGLGNVIINNTIIWGNKAYFANEIYNQSETVTLNYSCFANGIYDTEGSLIIDNCINTYPEFAGENNIYPFSLCSNSPCIDAGNNDFIDEDFDIRGTGFPRELNSQNGNAGIVDIGAYEYKFGFDPEVLPPPQLTTPSNNATGVSLNPTFQWSTVSGATAYDVQASLVQNFSTTVINQTDLNATNYTGGSLSASTLYYWRARGKNAEVNGDWSSVWNFTTAVNPPNTPTLSSPANNAIDQAVNVVLNWSAAGGATSYTVQVSLVSDFATTLVNQSGITGTSFTNSTLGKSTKYYWRLKAHNSGGESGWSSVWNFTTVAADPVPTSWDYTFPTGNSATVIIPTEINPKIKERNFANGDAVGFFFTRDNAKVCAGYGIWDGNNMSVTVWGDNSETQLKDGFVTDEPYTVRIWDGQIGKEYDANVTYAEGNNYYTVDGFSVLGSLNAITTVTQDISLLSGWNLISTFVEPEIKNMPVVWDGIKSFVTLVKNNSGQSYIPAYNINQIGNWNKYEGYQTYLTQAKTLIITGIGIKPENTPISLASGWKLVPYLRNSPQSIVTAVASLTSDNALKLVKNNSGQAYIPQYNINQIGNMIPGQGYQMYLTKNSTLTYPANSQGRASAGESVTPMPKVLIPEHRFTGSNSTLLVSVDAPDGNEIGVYNQNDELIGSGVVQNNIASVTIWGDDEQTELIDGALFNSECRIMNYELKTGRMSDLDVIELEDFITGEKIDGLNYKKDAIYFAKAGVIQNSTNISLNVRPNPASDIIEIEFTTPDCQATNLSIYTIEGKLISNLSDKLQNLKSNIITHNISSFTSGEYTIILTCENERAMRKVVVVR